MRRPRALRSDRIRVLINGLHARSGGGVTYLRNILPLMADDPRLELHLFLHVDQYALFAPIDERVRLHALDFEPGFWNRVLWEQIALPIVARAMSADVTFSPANYGPLFAPSPVIVLRNALTVGAREQRITKLLYWATLSLVTAMSLIGCRRAIAVSNYARRALSFGLTRWIGKKVAVVYHGVNPLFSPGAQTPRVAPFLLAVGDIYIQKNLHTLIAAMPKIRRSFPDIRLKIAGRRIDEEYFGRLAGLIDRLGLRESVIFLGEQRTEQLITLYRDCRVFVLPSTVETFGNPLVEAMASAAPVASSRTTAMPEIVGDGAVLFDPLDADDIARKIIGLLDDRDAARQIAAKGRCRSTVYSWQKTARATADIIVAAGGGARNAENAAP